MDLKLFEEKIESTPIYEGKILGLRKDKVRLEDNSESFREVISHNGGACVAALDDDDNILLVRQFRYPFNDVITEIPAGKLEKGEDPKECAIRELLEETGYEAGRVISLGQILPTPAYDEEVTHIFYADMLKKKETHLDEGEFLECLKIPFDDAVKMVLNGKIRDAKTVCGILKAQVLRSLN